MPTLLYYLISLISVFALTALCCRFLIPKLKSMKMGQKILDIGPRWHKSKENTPTMGGLSFLFSTTVVCIILGLIAYRETDRAHLLSMVFTLLYALANGLSGIIDDLVKFKKKQNEGLTKMQKLVLQTVFSGAYLALLRIYELIDTTVYIPFFSVELELGFAYYFCAMVLCVGVVNFANFTDGIDGLLSSVTMIIGAFFAFASFKYDLIPSIILSGAMSGATLGFLVYNFYPARVFMGDTGSLFLGGLAVGLAFMINNPLIIILVGIIYIFEGVSVALQICSFKLTKKRIFKMAPVHHHFEKCGWSEIKIVSVFSLVTLIFCIISVFGLR
ncbi:MAG: phospho-N-acetylmuramoyl-pentapeptide-transferase [Clostridia bacterium]|nr:phospho-N-acetylmuramoyl-pentapeptide-transferase [Clostridia bacterium]MBQ5800613.1 phospho-N-acetylmuramoyl-pentapeptide-transferase [Clostridia bacterium]